MRFILVTLLMMTQLITYAQTWVELANTPGVNFYEIQKQFNAFYKDQDLSQKSIGYKAFKRWEYFVEQRVYPSGNISLISEGPKNYQTFLKEYSATQAAAKGYSGASVNSATWIPVGPFGAPTGSLGTPTGSGRDNFICFQPGNNSILYAGSAGGSLWKSINGGTSWSSITEAIPTPGCSDLLIDPTNANIMYLASGSGDDQMAAYPVVSDGIYKTTDGGLTWLPTGLTFSLSQSRFIHKLAFDPTNSQILFAATNSGIYRSTNSGTTWTAVSSVSCWDLKFHPTNPNIVYACGSALFRSTNAGSSFTIVSSGIPTSGAYRMALAVAPISPSNLYVLACKSSDWQFMGVYTSTNDGLNFTTASTSPNILGNSCGGGSTGTGQGWYDLAIAASPTNANEIVVGGVNVFRSTNGGVNWNVIGCWNNTPWVHADVHDLKYNSNGNLYVACDGGVFSYTGSSWTNINGQRNIAQQYKIGLSSLTPNLWITGHQDNGTSVKNNTTYTYRLGGDGMDCFIDRTNDLMMFGSSQNGGLRRSTNGGASWGNATTGLTGTGGWVTPWKQDPVAANTIYCGYNQLFKSTTGGTSWTQMGTTGGGGNVIEFAVAPSNNQVIYVVYSGFIRKTSNGGLTWTNATPTGIGGSLTFITIDPSDANTAWVTVSGYTAGNKIFQTVDGGTTWMNVSANLPNLPANCSVYEPGSNDRIYVGMDIGVYYKDNSSATWTLYNAGLPNVAIMDMEMSPAAPGKLFAATYGRGVYEADAFLVTAAPICDFTVFGGVCVGKNNVLVDNSSNNPTGWTWSISPSAGVTINTQSVNNPTVTFSAAGIYTVSLISSNNFGIGAIKTQTITVSLMPILVVSANSPTVCWQEPFTLSASGANTYTWSNGGGNASAATYTAPGFNWTYTLTGANGACFAKQTISVTVTNCTGISDLRSDKYTFKVYPNPATDKLNIQCGMVGGVSLVITDVSGKIIREQNLLFKKENEDIQLNISNLLKGVYFVKITQPQGETQSIKFVKE
ncbi:MAG: T9SS type A sorting domain-containing protein [bacterium]|nr:T9SS type A sorting domain-containing protein [bacterium]